MILKLDQNYLKNQLQNHLIQELLIPSNLGITLSFFLSISISNFYQFSSSQTTKIT